MIKIFEKPLTVSSNISFPPIDIHVFKSDLGSGGRTYINMMVKLSPKENKIVVNIIPENIFSEEEREAIICIAQRVEIITRLLDLNKIYFGFNIEISKMRIHPVDFHPLYIGQYVFRVLKEQIEKIVGEFKLMSEDEAAELFSNKNYKYIISPT